MAQPHEFINTALDSLEKKLIQVLQPTTEGYFIQLILLLQVITRKMAPNHRYSKISIQKRQKLVHMIIEQKKTIAQAARKLIIKPSTAKLILNKFIETGKYFDKKMPNYARKTLKNVKNSQQAQVQIKMENQVKEQVAELNHINTSELNEKPGKLDYYPFQFLFGPTKVEFYY